MFQSQSTLGRISGSAGGPPLIQLVGTTHDLWQIATCYYLPSPITATRLMWAYAQGPTTAITGTYNIGIYDASGRFIVQLVGATAFGGAAGAQRMEEANLASTTYFDAGMYHVVFGMDGTNAGDFWFWGSGATARNISAYKNSGGTTLPTTLNSGFTESFSGSVGNIAAPLCGLRE
jgi:hypothetical protein